MAHESDFYVVRNS